MRLEKIEERWWCGFEPYTFVDIPREAQSEQSQTLSSDAEHDALGVPYERRAGDPAGDWRRERWAMRRNKEWAAIVEAWAKILTTTTESTVRAFGVEYGAGVDAEFTISRFTGWSRPSHQHGYFNRTY